jgi:hypothetical protein
LFIAVDDEETQTNFGTVANLVAELAAKMKAGAVEEFLSGADPWLIAKAMTTGATVVTHESYHPDAKKKFLIPNVCKHFGVDWINTFEMLDTSRRGLSFPLSHECWRRSNTDPPCRSKNDPGRGAAFLSSSCG